MGSGLRGAWTSAGTDQWIEGPVAYGSTGSMISPVSSTRERAVETSLEGAVPDLVQASFPYGGNTGRGIDFKIGLVHFF